MDKFTEQETKVILSIYIINAIKESGETELVGYFETSEEAEEWIQYKMKETQEQEDDTEEYTILEIQKLKLEEDY